MNTLAKLHIDNLARAKQPVNLIQNAEGASLYVYDVISADWGVSALSVIDAISQAGEAPVLNVYINSPGGDVFESRAIMAALDRFPGKTVAHIDSLCASAATSIALACNEVNMSQGALFMVHNASGMAWGDKQALRDTADLLQKVELSIIKDYSAKTGMPDEEVVALMDAETWMTADEALANGFIDNVVEAKVKPKMQNAWNLAAYKNAPAAPPDPVVVPEPVAEPALEAGFFMSAANTNRLALSIL
jgi:ATP-dependent Clp protease protease subunit